MVGDGTDVIQDFIQGTEVVDLPDGIGFDDVVIVYPGNGAIVFVDRQNEKSSLLPNGSFSATLETFGGTLTAADFR